MLPENNIWIQFKITVVRSPLDIKQTTALKERCQLYGIDGIFN